MDRCGLFRVSAIAIALVVTGAPESGAQTTGNLGVGIIKPTEPEIAAMLDLYIDAAGPAKKHVTWRLGGNYQYGMTGETIGSTVTYHGFNIRGSVLVSPGAGSIRGFYFGVGPSAIFRRVNTDIWGEGGGIGVTYNCAGASGVSGLWCGLMSNAGQSTGTADENFVDTALKLGGHVFAGYSRAPWHVEILYERGPSDVVGLGGLAFRFGISW